MTVDAKTIEKSVVSTVVALQQAYMVTNRVNQDDARRQVIEFVMTNVLTELLKYDIKGTIKSNLQMQVSEIVNEYKDKKDKAYTGLLRLEEMLR